MRAEGLLAVLLVGITLPAYPNGALADKTDRQYRHAVDIFRSGDLEAAARELEEILRKKPNYANARILLGAIHFRFGEKADHDGDRARALSEIEEALRLDPDEAYWHSALARVLNEQGDAEGATKECNAAATLSPDDSGLAFGCGLKTTAPPGTKAGEKQRKEARARTGSIKVGANITEPIATYRPDPPYSAKARSAHYQGTVVLALVVNAVGSVEDLSVVRPLGLGLDENALRDVLTWKFKPAERDGVPVPVRVLVEVSFRLY